MSSMTDLKTFSAVELRELLKTCATNLAQAYQETLEKSLFVTSEQAYLACNFLDYVIHKQQNTTTVH